MNRDLKIVWVIILLLMVMGITMIEVMKEKEKTEISDNK
tara:strand:- start:395 stop:511 length:117 start_codon:yes stop_codon:yes gene_type:complete